MMIQRFITSILLLTLSGLYMPQAVHAMIGERKAEEAIRNEEPKKTRHSIFSSFFLFKLFSARGKSRKGVVTLPGQRSTDEFDAVIPALRTSEERHRAIQALFRKHGFNNAVKWNIHRFTQNPEDLKKRLSRSGRYLRTIADILAEEDLPYELAYLPLIESGFDNRAYSKRNAAGPWQIIPSTARRLGLRIDWWVDERLDPVKSTRAAAKYLKYLYERFRSWNLALAAYNAGEGRVGRAVSRAGEYDFWKIRKSGLLASETSNYIPSYIAATAIALHPENFGISRIDYMKPYDFEEVIIDHPMDLDVVARLAGTEARLIRELNPELRRWCTPPNVSRYALRLPKGTKARFIKNMKMSGDKTQHVRFYRVRPGDTVAGIAQRIGASVRKIIEMNGLGRKAMIFAGEKILVPIESGIDGLMQSFAR
jgi:membrane-bound lytic murein transglycosylase D